MASDIGREGEKLFSLLCTRQGVTCNPSLEDDTGWDWFIEYPAEPVAGAAIDEQSAAPTALVQVKSTRGAGRSCRLRLSNALRMAGSPQPCFIVLFAFDGGEAPRIYVAHVWTDLIGRFLKAARIADHRRATAINRQWITVRFDEVDDRSDDPLTWMKAQIDAVQGSYAAAKGELVRSVGYEDGHGKIVATIELDSHDDIIDLHLGLKESVRCSRFVQTSVRFGIPAAMPSVDIEGGKLFLTPVPREGTLRLRNAAGDQLMVPASLYGADLPGLAPEQRRTRLSAGCLEILLAGNGTAQSKASIMVDDAMPLERILQFVTLCSWEHAGPIAMQLVLGEERLDVGSLELGAPKHEADWTEFADAVRLLDRLCRAEMRDDVRLSISAINKAAGELELLSALASERTMRIEFTPAPNCPPRFDTMLAYTSATIASMTFGVLARRPVVEDAMHGERRRVVLGPAKLLTTLVERGSAGDNLALPYAQALARVDDASSFLEAGDLREFIKSAEEADHIRLPG